MALRQPTKLDWKPKITFDEFVSEMVEADCRAYGIVLAWRENTMTSRHVHLAVSGTSAFQARRGQPASVSSIVWIGKFTHPAKQKTSRSIHAIDDFAKNLAFKEIAIFVA